MSHEHEQNPSEEEGRLSFSQRMYSKIFLGDIYPQLLFPVANIFEDSPETFSGKFIQWKEKQLSLFEGEEEKNKLIKSVIEKVSLFEVTKTSVKELKEVQDHLHSHRSGEDVNMLLREVNYWNWAKSKSKSASELWRIEE